MEMGGETVVIYFSTCKLKKTKKGKRIMMVYNFGG